MRHPDDLYHKSILGEFLEDFGLAKIHIKLFSQLNRTRRWHEGRILQHSRWERMGHKFVFTGLDNFITTGKEKDG